MEGANSTGARESAVFGGGCFWCVEAVFQRLDGVASVESGYAGGHVENPTYEQICSKTTGHAEVCRITYDPQKVSYANLLEVFFRTHDPTTKDQQGNDVGPQYRSIILWENDEQKHVAVEVTKNLDASGAWDRPIVTEIESLKKFYPAENYHQDYYQNNPQQGYCRFVIAPKIEKFEKAFSGMLREDTP